MRDVARSRFTVEPRLVPVVAGFLVVEHVVLAMTVPADAWQQHTRSGGWALVVTGMIVLMLFLRRVSVGCWLLVAGAGGNLISWAEDGTVPNYLTVAVADRWLAFNLADAAIVTGAVMVIATVAIRAARRERLFGARRA
jgi:hypothetical protein